MKKRNVALYLFFAISALLFTSCIGDVFGVSGKGDSVIEGRTVTAFHSIELQTSANVSIVRDTLYKVEVEDYSNIVKYTVAKVSSQNLVISIFPSSTVLLNSAAKVRITMPDSLKTLIVSGSGKIDVDTTFKDIEVITVTGSGNVSINRPVNLTKLSTTIKGKGTVSATGKVAALTAVTSGSGNTNLSQLVSTASSCTLSGSGNMYINATTSLKAFISGSGSVYYSGNPAVSDSITGSGSVVKQ